MISAVAFDKSCSHTPSFLAQLMCDSWGFVTLSGDGIVVALFTFCVCGLTHKRANYERPTKSDAGRANNLSLPNDPSLHNTGDLESTHAPQEFRNLLLLPNYSLPRMSLSHCVCSGGFHPPLPPPSRSISLCSHAQPGFDARAVCRLFRRARVSLARSPHSGNVRDAAAQVHVVRGWKEGRRKKKKWFGKFEVSRATLSVR